MLCKYSPRYGPQPWPCVLFDAFDKRVSVQKWAFSPAGTSPLETHSFVSVMSLTFPMEFKYLDVEGPTVFSGTSPSVGFVWLTSGHSEGNHSKDRQNGTVGRRKPRVRAEKSDSSRHI